MSFGGRAVIRVLVTRLLSVHRKHSINGTFRTAAVGARGMVWGDPGGENEGVQP